MNQQKHGAMVELVSQILISGAQSSFRGQAEW